MKPKHFPQVNKTYVAPKGQESNCFSLFVSECTNGAKISCWELTEDELAKINKTKEIWLHIYSQALPPSLVSVDNPFGDDISFTDDRVKVVEGIVDNINLNANGGMILMGISTKIITLTLDEFEYVVATLPYAKGKTNAEVKEIAKTIDTICLGLIGQQLLIVRR